MMMRFPRKVNYCLIVTLILVTLIFRYPLDVEHEMGSDTTFIHTMANSITQDGYAKWILHPTSHFGLYALSYPSAAPFILSSGHQVANISIEGMVLILGLLLAVLGVLSSYLVGKLIRDSDVFAHLVALLFTIAPFYIKDTSWVASSRGFVVALLPSFMLLLIKHIKTKDVRYLILALALFLVLSSMHRMGLLSVLIITAYLLSIPLHMVTQRLRFSLIKFEKPFRFAMVALALVAFLSIFYVQFMFPGVSGANVVEEYQQGVLLSGTSFPTLVVNMAVSLVGRVGILLPLFLIGLVAFAWKRPKEATDKFFLMTTFVFLPLLSLRDYIAEFLIPVFVILVAIGILTLFRSLKNRQQLGAVLIVGLIVASIAFTWVTKDRWRNLYSTDQPIPESVYDVSLYIGSHTWGTIASNAGLLGGRIAAISGLPNMPLGGASTHFFSSQQLMWGFVDGNNMAVRLVDLTKISFNTDAIYNPVGVGNAEYHWELILGYRDPQTSNQHMRDYNVHFVVSDITIFPRYTSYGHLRTSCLQGDDGLHITDPNKVCRTARNVLQDNYYAVFGNSATIVWFARGGLR